jgi:hypothetical protein
MPRHAALFALSLILIAGTAYAQSSSAASGNATHSMTVLPRPDPNMTYVNSTSAANSTLAVQPHPRPANLSSANVINATDSNATRYPGILPRPGANLTNPTSAQAGPLQNFISGIASFFSNLFS